MPLVGCTKQNKPIIESSFHELLAILDTFATRDEFIFATHLRYRYCPPVDVPSRKRWGQYFA
jgi:hypothetical protein